MTPPPPIFVLFSAKLLTVVSSLCKCGPNNTIYLRYALRVEYVNPGLQWWLDQKCPVNVTQDDRDQQKQPVEQASPSPKFTERPPPGSDPIQTLSISFLINVPLPPAGLLKASCPEPAYRLHFSHKEKHIHPSSENHINTMTACFFQLRKHK